MFQARFYTAELLLAIEYLHDLGEALLQAVQLAACLAACCLCSHLLVACLPATSAQYLHGLGEALLQAVNLAAGC